MHAHAGRYVGHVVGWGGGDFGGEGLRAVGGGAALFDDGVEFADGVVDVGFCAAKGAGARRGGGIGAVAGGRWEAGENACGREGTGCVGAADGGLLDGRCR